MDLVDPGDPRAIEIALSAPFHITKTIFLNVNGQTIPIHDGIICSLCCATLRVEDVPSHNDWHQMLAAAISNAANMAHTIQSLVRGPHDDSAGTS